MDINALLGSLNLNPVALVFNIVGFLLLLYVANNMVFKPIGKVLEERQQDVKTTYDQIEADQKQMQALRADYEQRLATIEAEAREKIQSAIKEAQSARDQIIGDAQSRARETVARAESEVAREREQAMITLKGEIVDLAMGATTKIIGDNLDETRQRRLIDEFITQGTTPKHATAYRASEA
jgi:F-type H+-transporting ATPase subunit b